MTEVKKIVMGRPREYDRIKIGYDMIEWAIKNPDALSVPMFATSIGMHSGILRAWSDLDPDFRELYMEAKEIIGINRLKMTFSESVNKLETSIYRQTLHHYDNDIRADVREDKAFESALRRDEGNYKDTTVNVRVSSHGLGSGIKVSAEGLSTPHNKGSK